MQNRTKEIARETFFREDKMCSSRFSGNGQWHSSLLLLVVTIMLIVVVVDVMLVTTMIMDHLLLLLTAS
jgi:hypothetical protein